MKKFFKFGKSKKDGLGSASGSTESLAATGYHVKEKDLSKLHKAAWTGDLAKVRVLAKKDPNALDKENRTPLHFACARGHTAVVQELIEWKAKVNVGDNDARTPLIKAVECGHEESARLLLEANADPNTADKHGDAPMHYAGRQGSVPLTKILLAPDRTDIDIRNKEGQSALHIAIAQRDDHLAELLLDEGADTNSQDSDGRTALMLACHDGSTSLTKLLLEYQAKTQLKDAKGWTADDIAIMASHDGCRQLLGTAAALRSETPHSETTAKPSPYKSTTSEARGKAPVEDNIFGGPAIDQAEDSIAEESQSKISEAIGGNDSWADTDEESEILDPKKKKSQRPSTSKSKPPVEEDIAEADEEPKEDEKVPNLDLRKLKDANTSWDDQDGASKIPRLNNAAEITTQKKYSDSNTSKSHIPVSKKDSGGSHPPVSARSSASVRSALSYGNADSNWSDDDSLFSSTSDAKKKPVVPLLRPKAVGKDEQQSEWSDDDMSAVDGEVKGRNINAVPDTPRSSGVNQDAEAIVGAPLGSSTARSNKDDKEKTEAETAKERHKRPPDAAKEMLEDLGLSDVSDVSDPDFGDDTPPLSSHASLKLSANRPPPAPKRLPSVGDEWETDTPRSTAVKTKVPLSARSTGSNWDSSIAEEDEEKPVKPNLAALTRGKQASQESLSQWDSEPVEAVHTSHSKDPDAGKTNKPESITGKVTDSQKEDSLWDSDVEDELAPTVPAAAPPLPSSPPPQTAPNVNMDKAILPEASPTASKEVAALKMSTTADGDEDSKWDSTDGVVSTPRQVKPTHTGAPVATGAMFAREDTDEDDIEEEEESTWEKESKDKRMLQKQRSLEREQQWEIEYRLRQEQHRLEAQEELRKEKEEEERLRKQQEEEENFVKEEEEKEKASKEVQDATKEDGKKNEKDEHQRKIQENEKKDQDSKKHASLMTAGTVQSSGAVSDEDEDQKWRERANVGVEAAIVHQKVNGVLDNFLDDDEDTFNDVDVPDLDVPHKVERMYSSTSGVMAGPSSVHGQGAQEEDALSYSSTEQDASMHEHFGTSNGLIGTNQLNLSFNSDTVNVVRLQDQVREARRLLDKERSTRTSMENKRKNLEKEKSELITKLEEVTRAKSQLEQAKIDIDAKMRTLQYQVTEETEKCRNAEVLLGKTKEQLSRKEDQYTSEVEAKQKAELSMRNLQMELRTTLSNIKQLEEEKEDLARVLQHEKSARQLQEQINEEQQRLSEQLKVTEEGAQPAAAMNKLEEADESRKAALDSIEKLRAELYATKMELERQKSRFKDDHGLLSSENEDLHMKVEDLKSDIKLQEEALAHATMQYNIQVSQLKTDNSVLTSSLEKERLAREKLDMEVESLRSRLSSTSTELEKSQVARSELERNNHKEHEEWSRLLDRRDVELNSLKETNQNLSHRVGGAEAKVAALESELHIANATLIERTNQLSTLQRELDQRRGNQENMDESFRKDREDNVRMSTKIETLSERLTSIQHENLNLKQQLDEARLKDLSRDQSDSAEKINNMMSSLRAEHEKARSLLEEKNSMLQVQVGDLREELRATDSRRTNMEQQLQRNQLELTEASKRVSVAEASLGVAQRAKEQSEHERLNLRAEVDKLQTRLDDAREKVAEANAKSAHLNERLEQAERNTMATSQQLMSQSADVHNFAKNKKDKRSAPTTVIAQSELEVEMHRLELENTKLEAALKHETDHVVSLQKELNDSSQKTQKLQEELIDLKASNTHLKYSADEAAMSRTLATQEAEDSRQLWETEVKGRSKLGLRIAQLEREKQEVQGQIDEEKRRTRKAIELKRNTEVKLENELQKATQLQKEVATLKAHLKAAKKRLRELDTSDNRINILTTDFNNERREMERTISTTRRQLEEIQSQLSNEIETKDRLEQKTRQLTSELKSLTHMEKTYRKLEHAKRKLEEDLASYKNHISNNYIERTELERIKSELEAKSRVELNAKLEEVNNYLEEQALARQRLDSMRDTNENEMRKDFEKTKKELMDELNKLRGSYHETATSIETKDFEAKRFKDLYESELKLRERLAEKLEQATEKAAKAQMFMDRQFTGSTGVQQNNWMSSSAPSPLLLGKTSPGHGVNDLSQKIRAELNRSIAKHMEKSPHIDISLPPRSFDDINLGTSSFNKASTDYLEVLKKNYMLS